MADIRSATAENRRRKKKKIEEETTGQKMSVSASARQGGHNKHGSIDNRRQPAPAVISSGGCTGVVGQ